MISLGNKKGGSRASHKILTFSVPLEECRLIACSLSPLSFPPFLRPVMKLAVFSALSLLSPAFSLVVDHSAREVKLADYYNRPYDGTPVAWFTANASIPVAKILTATKKATNVLDKYPVGFGKSSPWANIYGDWSTFTDVSMTLVVTPKSLLTRYCF